MHSEHPELIQDLYWDEVFPQELPYTIAAEQFRREPPQGSTANIEVSEQEQEFLPIVEEDDEDIQESMSGINVSKYMFQHAESCVALPCAFVIHSLQTQHLKTTPFFFQTDITQCIGCTTYKR